MKNIYLLLVFPTLLVLNACTTVSSTSPSGIVVNARAINWTAVDTGVRLSAEAVSALVLNNNPSYANDVSAINTAIASIFVGTPTSESVAAAISAAAPNLSASDIEVISTAVTGAVAIYISYSGKSSLTAGDAIVQGILTALTDGISSGVTLHNASISVPTS